MTSTSNLSWEELAELHPTDVHIESARRLVEAVGMLHSSTVSQQKTTNRLTEVLVFFTFVILALTIAQVVFFVWDKVG